MRWQRKQALIARIGEDERLLIVEEREGLRDALDGVAQPDIGSGAHLGLGLLVGDIDGDADEMRRLVRRQPAADADPDPAAVGMKHAELAIDAAVARPGVGATEGRLVVGMDPVADVGERQEIIRPLTPQQCIEAVRDEDPAARDVPVPETGTAAAEHAVDPAADLSADDVGFGGAGALLEEGDAEGRNDDGRREGEQREGERALAPDARGVPDRLDQRQPTHVAGQGPHRCERIDAARQLDAHDARLVGKDDERLGLAQQFIEACGASCVADPTGDAAVAALEVGGAVVLQGVRRQRRHEMNGSVGVRRRRGARQFDRQVDRGQRGEEIHFDLSGGDGFVAPVAHLDGGAAPGGEQESDDHDGNQPPQRRLRSHPLQIGRLGHSLGQTAASSRARKCAARVDARHRNHLDACFK